MSQLLEYKCPNCGGAITFDPQAQELVCPYCKGHFQAQALQAMDSVLSQPAQNPEWQNQPGAEWSSREQDGMNIYACKSCGGEIIGDATLAASSCPFCGNPVVMTRQFTGDLRPDLVVPFKQDKAAAIAALTRHYKGKPFLPKLFREANHLDEIKGLYVPFWLFSAHVDAQISYKATRVRSWSDTNYDYTETSHYQVNREGSLAFANVPCDASSKMPDDLMDSLEPFDWRDSVDFQTAYLAGFFADRYDVDSAQSTPRANARIYGSTEALFRQSVTGYTTVVAAGQNILPSHGTVRYGLLPVWLLNTRRKDKTYTFAMNGQTGKFVGDLPISAGKFAAWFFGLAAAFSGIIWLLLYFLT
ncbi:MAG: TFIIB-type zinc ribbon-containing protein [Oscillospiraceae bacterium]|jgi:DNA-directed RNA polymerase subunit RPC12/RpoP|nr:TFIIB-type zinc ribbon-containing protein [Oscillospiraceae bacterium]